MNSEQEASDEADRFISVLPDHLEYKKQIWHTGNRWWFRLDIVGFDDVMIGVFDSGDVSLTCKSVEKLAEFMEFNC